MVRKYWQDGQSTAILHRFRPPPIVGKPETHGSAKLQTASDLARAGIIGDDDD
jgi:hypothetical protein